MARYIVNNNYHIILRDKGIRPSVQRVAVYSYLMENPIHPDVETVYTALSPLYPTLSRTTVYNTLKLFEANDLVQALRIEEDKLRFDAEMKDHLHFKCIKCGSITDVFDDSQVPGMMQNCSSLIPSGFKMEKIQTTLWGLCKNCNK